MSHLLQTLLTFFFLFLLLPSLQAQNNVHLLGHKTYDEKLNDIWGYVAPDGTEYALVGTKEGFSIVDLSDVNQLEEVAKINIPPSTWRDIKTWGHYAYVVDEDSNQGMYIIDLSNIDSLSYTIWTGDTQHPFLSAHNIWIDEKGFAYLFAPDIEGIGTLIVDLKSDPLHPSIVGTYNDTYVHDGFVRGDTMWTAEIFTGTLNAVDVSDKQNLIWLGGTTTPDSFTHNCWVSPDNKVAFTTDEKGDAFITSYDVSDVTDMKELDRVRSTISTHNIPHNTFVHKNWLVTAYYNDGIIIHDITYPDNIIQVGHYDTNPLMGSDPGGAWGVYPYLPSGRVLVSDMQEGLFVLDVNYIQACHLHGSVRDQQTEERLAGVQIQIVDDSDKRLSTIRGDYKIAIAVSGTYDVIYKKQGYAPFIAKDVQLTNGEVKQIDVALTPLTPFRLTGSIVDKKGKPINNAKILMTNEVSEYNQVTDASGNFSIPAFYEGAYDIYIGAWGYKVLIESNPAIPFQAEAYQYVLEEGIYQDHFLLDYGWTVAHNSDIKDGKWVREVPINKGFAVGRDRPAQDSPYDLGNTCFLTGNHEQYKPLRQGESNLTSPLFDLSKFKNPELCYSLWFSNSSQFQDSLNVFISNGQEEILLETISNYNAAPEQYQKWHNRTLKLDNIDLTDQMQIRFSAVNDSASNLSALLVGIDAFQIIDLRNTNTRNSNTPSIQTVAIPNPFTDYTIISLDDSSYKYTDFTIRVFNTMDTQIVSKKMQEGQAIIYGHHLSPGVYLYVIEREGWQMGNGKIVVY